MTIRTGAPVLAIIVAALAGCGNWVGDPPPPKGAIGVSVNGEGAPVIVMAVCSSKVSRLQALLDGTTESDPASEITAWTRRPAAVERDSFEMFTPSAPWSVSKPIDSLPARTVFVVDATKGTPERAGSLRDLAFQRKELSTLMSDEVLYTDFSNADGVNKKMKRAGFQRQVCAEIESLRSG